MRRHFYLVVDAPDEDVVGGVDIRDQRYEVAKKNEQRAIQKRDLDTNELFTETVVSLGYHDFEDQSDYEERNWLVTLEKLSEIDEAHLQDAGVEPEMVERKLAQAREEEVATDGGVVAAECPNCYTDDDSETDCPHLLAGDDCPNCGHELEKPSAGKVRCPNCLYVVNGMGGDTLGRTFPITSRETARLLDVFGYSAAGSPGDRESRLWQFCEDKDLDPDEFADVLRDLTGRYDGGEE